MKILLVNKYHYVKGGSETYHFGLAKLLEEHGNEVIYFAMEDEKTTIVRNPNTSPKMLILTRVCLLSKN